MKLAVFVLALLSSLTPTRPEWCKQLPRPAYSKLERVQVKDPWFEVYRIRPGVIAIYEPHQSEEVICYLILGTKRAVLFDTGMGISNIRAVVESLTTLPVTVVNSHTHNDHVGDNWRFSDIYGMDTDFTRANAKGSKEDAQAEIEPEKSAAICPPDSTAPNMPPGHFIFLTGFTITTRSISASACSRSLPLPATPRTRLRFWMKRTACSLPAIPSIPARSGCSARKPIWMPMSPR